MSRIEKDIQKIYKEPIPNDITFEELSRVAKFFGCNVITNNKGRHSCRIVHVQSGTVIPIPKHGNTVQEVYIKQFKELIDMIKEEEK